MNIINGIVLREMFTTYYIICRYLDENHFDLVVIDECAQVRGSCHTQ